jgi:hypothetical protein
VFLCLPALAQVTVNEQKAYFKALAKVATLKLQVAEAEAEVQKAIAGMIKSCDGLKVIANAEGDPVCEAPPAKQK